MTKIKFYRPSGLQKQARQIESIDKNDNFNEKKSTKSALLKEQCSTRIKANEVVLFEQTPDTEKGLE